MMCWTASLLLAATAVAAENDYFPAERKLLAEAEAAATLHPDMAERGRLRKTLIEQYARLGYVDDAERVAKLIAPDNYIAHRIATARLVYGEGAAAWSVAESFRASDAAGAVNWWTNAATLFWRLGEKTLAANAILRAKVALRGVDAAKAPNLRVLIESQEKVLPDDPPSRLRRSPLWEEVVRQQKSLREQRDSLPAGLRQAMDAMQAKSVIRRQPVRTFPITPLGFRAEESAPMRKAAALDAPFLEKLYKLSAANDPALMALLNQASPTQKTLACASVIHSAVLLKQWPAAELMLDAMQEDRADLTLAKAEALVYVANAVAPGSLVGQKKSFEMRARARALLATVTQPALRNGRSQVALEVAASAFTQNDTDAFADVLADALKQSRAYANNWAPSALGEALEGVLHAQLAVGDKAGAEATAKKMLDLDSRTSLSVASEFVDAGETETALTLARAIPSPGLRAKALVDVAYILVARLPLQSI